MTTLFIYIIKSTFCLLLFYLGYKVLLSRETFLDFNRKVLLGGMILCLILPLIKLKISSPGVVQQSFLQLEKMVVVNETMFLPEMILTEEVTESVASLPRLSFFSFCRYFYFFGIGVVALSVLNSLLSVWYLIHSGQQIRTKGYIVVLLDRAVTPFNWWKYIIISCTDYKKYSEEILTHELAHYRRRHGWDLFFAEWVILLHWFNPAAWLLKRELQEIHEYQADKVVLESGIDATKYQLLLVKKAVGSSSYTFANSFNQSKLKKRITMMCKKQSNQWARWKLLLLVPVACFTVYAFARPDVNRQLKQLIPDEDTVIQSDNKPDLPESFMADLKDYFGRRGDIPDLNDRELAEWFMERTHIVVLLMNWKGQLMYENQLVTWEELPFKLETSWLKEYADDRPVMICIQDDRASPEDKRQELFATVQETFLDLGKRVSMRDGQPLLVYYYQPKDMRKRAHIEESSEIDLTDVQIAFHIRNSPMGKLNLVMHESLNNLSEVMERFNPEDVIQVEIKAPAKTKMHVITAIKEQIRQLGINRLHVKYTLLS